MNKDLPKVSVVTITYGHEKYITETLDGVLIQQYAGPVEFIIANDNSPDATDEVVKKYFLENPAPSNFEIKYTKHETNKGMMPNFIWALEQTTGKYIANCEGDDYWTDPLKLQKQVVFLEGNEEYVLTFHPVKIKNPDGSLVDDLITEVPANYELQETLALKGNYIHTPSVVFRNVIKDFPPEFSLSPIGDYFLYMILTSHGKIKMINDNMAVYRQGVGVWSNEGVVERQATTVFCLELLGIYFKADKTIYSLLRTQRKNLLQKMLNFSVKKEEILADFVSNLDEVEIRLTPKSLMKIIVLKIKRKLIL